MPRTARPSRAACQTASAGERKTLKDSLVWMWQLVPRRGTNCHIHTNESFSVFRSPAEAVWQAAREGLAVLGINDHYTVAGHEEFRQACEIAGIAAGFSMEAVGMDRAAEASRLLLNDPDNPGRVYL